MQPEEVPTPAWLVPAKWYVLHPTLPPSLLSSCASSSLPPMNFSRGVHSRGLNHSNPPSLLPIHASTSELRRDPYGVVLVISPFNYPFQLAFVPIMNALAAGTSSLPSLSSFLPSSLPLFTHWLLPSLLPSLSGNCVLLKPSELTHNVSALFSRLVPA